MFTKKLTTLLPLFALALIPLQSNAQENSLQNTNEYNFELSANYNFTNTKFDNNLSPDSKTNLINGSFAYYFNKVKTDKGPLALASFFDRASAVQITYGTGKFKSQGVKPDLNIVNVAGIYVHKTSGWLTYGNYTHTKINTNPSTKTNSYTFALGKYIAENSTVNIGYTKIDDDFREGNTYTLSNFHAQAVGNDKFFDGGLAISYTDYDNLANAFEFSLETTYYFTKNIGLGLAGSYTTSKEMDSFQYGINAEWFIANNFSINAQYNRINTNNDVPLPDFDNNIIDFGLKLRL